MKITKANKKLIQLASLILILLGVVVINYKNTRNVQVVFDLYDNIVVTTGRLKNNKVYR